MGSLNERLNRLSPEKRQYLLQNLPRHLLDARETSRLHSLLTDFAFLDEKVNAVGPQASIDDYRIAIKSRELEATPSMMSLWEAIFTALLSEAYYIQQESKCTVQQVHNALLRRLKGNPSHREGENYDTQLIEMIQSADSYQASQGQHWFKLSLSAQHANPINEEVLTLAEGADVKFILERPNHPHAAVCTNHSISSFQVWLWDWEKVSMIDFLEGFSGNLIGGSWLLDGDCLLLANSQGNIYVVDVKAQTIIERWSVDTPKISSISISPDNHLLACLARGDSNESRITIWNLSTHEKLSEVEAEAEFHSILFSRDNHHVLLGGTTFSDEFNKNESSVYRYDVMHGAVEEIYSSPFGDSVIELALDHQNRFVACGERNGSVIIINIKSRMVYAAFPGSNRAQRWKWSNAPQTSVPTAHHGWVQCLAFSPDDQWLASGSGLPRGYGTPGELCVWNLQEQQLHQRSLFSGGLQSLIFVSQNQLLFGGQDFLSTLRVKQKEISPYSPTVANYVATVAFSPHGNRKVLALGKDLIISSKRAEDSPTIIHGHAGQIKSVDWHPSRDLIASAGDDPFCYIWDVKEGTLFKKITWPFGGIKSIRFSPDGLKVAACGGNGRCILASITGEIMHDFIYPEHEVLYALAFSRDNRLLAIGGASGECSIWDLQMYHQALSLVGHTGEILDIDFTFSGDIATISIDMTCRVWDLHTGQQKQQYHTKDSNSAFRNVVCHPDVPLIVTSGDDKTCQIWHQDKADYLAYLPTKTWTCGIKILPDTNMLLRVDTLGREEEFTLLPRVDEL